MSKKCISENLLTELVQKYNNNKSYNCLSLAIEYGLHHTTV